MAIKDIFIEFDQEYKKFEEEKEIPVVEKKKEKDEISQKFNENPFRKPGPSNPDPVPPLPDPVPPFPDPVPPKPTPVKVIYTPKKERFKQCLYALSDRTGDLLGWIWFYLSHLFHFLFVSHLAGTFKVILWIVVILFVIANIEKILTAIFWIVIIAIALGSFL